MRGEPAEIGELTIAVCAGAGIDDLVGGKIPATGSTSGQVFRERFPRNVLGWSSTRPAASTSSSGPLSRFRCALARRSPGVLLAVRDAGSAAFDEQELQVVSSFADRPYWRCNGPKRRQPAENWTCWPTGTGPPGNLPYRMSHRTREGRPRIRPARFSMSRADELASTSVVAVRLDELEQWPPSRRCIAVVSTTSP
ncbi:hypothetical protein [Saccharopolyspora phatthalungensis]|uniref:Uncharacterized protein n=1 Tax=Saccharopolyspora phatthalungensis TaxID=664693 RepID=A0A840QBN9_9PSEU|nr:hypothetical protein [Saccharopolyspora phatthalungensis]MBB5155969.1 hypothetical protein [Saccharopolyspora phatthalungensis]